MQQKIWDKTKLNSYTFSNSWQFVLGRSPRNKLVYYFYSEVYYFIFGTFQNSKYDAQSNSIYIPFHKGLSNTVKPIDYQLFYTYMTKMLNNFNYIYIAKLLYSGKGYRLYVRKKFFIYPKLNYSHKLYIYSFNTIIHITTRWTMIFYAKSYRNFRIFLLNLLRLRSYNTFTKKGIRLKKQVLYHKVGKVSTY